MDPSDSKIITMSSFLAGLLLVRRNITSDDIYKCMNDFTNKYNCELDEPFNDFNKLANIVYFDGNTMYLKEESFIIDNYLYDLTTFEVREYFSIGERDDTKVYEENKIKKKSIVNIMKRTKIYVRP